MGGVCREGVGNKGLFKKDTLEVLAWQAAEEKTRGEPQELWRKGERVWKGGGTPSRPRGKASPSFTSVHLSQNKKVVD